MDHMFIDTILTLAINDQGRMLIGQLLNLMKLPSGTIKDIYSLKPEGDRVAVYTNVQFNLVQRLIKMLQWSMPGE
jgi:hypothetical protein